MNIFNLFKDPGGEISEVDQFNMKFKNSTYMMLIRSSLEGIKRREEF